MRAKAVLLVLAWLAVQGWYGPVNYIEANNTQRLDNSSSTWSLHIDEAAASQVADAAALEAWPFQDVTDSTTWYYSAVRALLRGGRRVRWFLREQ